MKNNTNKNLLIIVLGTLMIISIISMIGYFVYTSFKNKTFYKEFDNFEKDFNINLDGSKIIDELDEKIFFGDGTLFQVIEVNPQVKNEFDEWENFTLENYKRILKYDENGNIVCKYNEKVIIPNIMNGKSIFINRNYDDLEWHSSHNFSFAVYNIDNNLLYYLKEDS